MGSQGTIISGRYEIIRLIGEGGMGKVYEARHVHIGRKVALKILLKDFISDQEVLERFHREASIAGNLGHANIVEVMDFGITADGMPFIVMEYLEGRSLADLISSEGMLEISKALEIMKQVLFGLSEAHRKDIIHRDLKPENIFLAQVRGRGDEVKILDFGISKVMREAGPAERLTKTGRLMGTPYYMSPEQIKGQAVDRRADVYACGVILFEMVTGQAPFLGNSYNEVIIKATTEPIPDPRRFNARVPKYLVEIIVRAMDKNPDLRFKTADDFMESLLNIDGIKLLEPIDDDESATVAFVGREKDEVLRRIKEKSRAREEKTEDTTIDRKRLEAGPAETPVKAEARIVTGPAASKRRKMILYAGALALIFVVVAAATIIGLSVTGGGQKAGPAGEKGTAGLEGGAATTALAPAGTVKITLVNFPPGATVKHGDIEMPAGQIPFARGTQPGSIVISADGYQTQSLLFIPDHDQILDATLARSEAKADEAFEKAGETAPEAKAEPVETKAKKEKEEAATAQAHKAEEPGLFKDYGMLDSMGKKAEEPSKKTGSGLTIEREYEGDVEEPAGTKEKAGAKAEVKETKEEKTKKTKKEKEEEGSKFKWNYEE